MSYLNHYIILKCIIIKWTIAPSTVPSLQFLMNLMNFAYYCHRSVVSHCIFELNFPASPIHSIQKGKIRGKCYKTFQGRWLRIFIISKSVCPWQALPSLFAAKKFYNIGIWRMFTCSCSIPCLMGAITNKTIKYKQVVVLLRNIKLA